MLALPACCIQLSTCAAASRVLQLVRSAACTYTAANGKDKLLRIENILSNQTKLPETASGMPSQHGMQLGLVAPVCMDLKHVQSMGCSSVAQLYLLQALLNRAITPGCLIEQPLPIPQRLIKHLLPIPQNGLWTRSSAGSIPQRFGYSRALLTSLLESTLN